MSNNKKNKTKQHSSAHYKVTQSTSNEQHHKVHADKQSTSNKQHHKVHADKRPPCDEQHVKTFLPNTGVPAINALVVIVLIISAVGICTYAISGVRYIVQDELSRAFPNVMYILSYISIVQYAINYFIRGKFCSLYAVVANFSLVTMLTTLNIQNVNNQLVAVAIAIFILTTLVKNEITHFKRCIVIIIVVFAGITALICLKYYYGYVVLESSNPADVVISIYSSYRLAILWGLFTLMYFMRYYLVRRRFKEHTELNGKDSARITYFEELKELAKMEAMAKIEAQYEGAMKESKKRIAKNANDDC